MPTSALDIGDTWGKPDTPKSFAPQHGRQCWWRERHAKRRPKEWESEEGRRRRSTLSSQGQTLHRSEDAGGANRGVHLVRNTPQKVSITGKSPPAEMSLRKRGGPGAWCRWQGGRGTEAQGEQGPWTTIVELLEGVTGSAPGTDWKEFRRDHSGASVLTLENTCFGGLGVGSGPGWHHMCKNWLYCEV